jgi:acetyl esterase/lipase
MRVTASTKRVVAGACGMLAMAAGWEVRAGQGAARAATVQQAPPPAGQQPPAQGRGRGRGQQVPIDEERARRLYVSNRFEDHPRRNFEADLAAKAKEDARYPELCKGILECTKTSYRSRVGDMDIPAYLFQPLQKRGPRGHAAMIWVHGGVHGNWTLSPYFPFVKEAVARGYVVIAPEYRGSTGYGEAHHMAIDYGGKEVDDVMSAFEHLKTLPHVDPDRVGMMGWSHGGYITLLSLFRDSHPSRRARRSCRSAISSSGCPSRAPTTSAASRRRRRSSACRSNGVRSTCGVRRSSTSTSCRCRCSSTSPPTTPT